MNATKKRIIQFSIEAERASMAEMRSYRQHRNAVLRLALVGAYKAMGKVVVPALGRHLDGKYLGSGFEQVAFRTGNGEVTKIIIDSIGSSSEDAAHLARRQQSLSNEVQSYLGSNWLETEFYATKLPKAFGGFAVAAVQPEIRPVAKFETPAAVPAYSPQGWYRDMVGRLSQDIDDLYQETGMYPDLFGAGNVVLEDPNQPALKFVDTLPQTPDALDRVTDDGLSTRRKAHAEVIKSWGEFSRTAIEPYESAVLALH